MRKIFMLFVMVLVTTVVMAQGVIKGRVTDAKTGQPVAFVTVTLKGQTQGTYTDENGFFTLSGAPGAIIVINDVRYAAFEVTSVAFTEIKLTEASNNLTGVTVVGSRNLNRSVINSPVPIDIVNLKAALKTSPQIDLNQALTYLVPSFNSVRQSSSDGTEHIDPASLRGLGPDQTLVLVNGKRQHTTSLLNNQGTFGNGSVGTDLNAIPASAIDHIEVLRDGASAQYGSDAIAGVINIVLKENTNALSVGVTGGITSRGDGETSDLNLNWGTGIGKNGGYLNLGAELLYRGKTTRTQNHDLIIFDQSAIGNYFAYDFTEDPAASRAYDDSVLSAKGQQRSDYNFQIGDAKIMNSGLAYNLSIPFNKHTEFYSFGTFNYRNGKGFGFRRLPSEYENMVYSIYPDGFQPNTGSDIYDETFALGIRWDKNDWNFDISNMLGDNRFDYNVSNTVNASMQEASPTSFKAGGHEFFQNTLNFDVTKYFAMVMNGFNLAMGAEFRVDQYKIREGEEASWKNYGLVTLPDGSVEDQLGLAGGSQSFPGFQPYNAGTHSRNNTSLYADAELNVTEKWMIGGAARFENYSDFGSTLNGKFTTRYELSKAFALRGAVSTGFRAPSLHQQYFSYVSTDLINGKIGQSGFFPTNSDVAKFIGIPELKEETSVNASAGFTYNPGNKLRITVDGYYIRVNNRITLTGNFGEDVYGDPDPVIQDYLEPYGASTARFFVNSVDTRTYGVDLVATYNMRLANGDRLDFALIGNYNNNKVDQVNDIPEKLASQPDIYFSPAERALIETINPRIKGNFTISYTHNKLGILFRNEHFGTVTKDGFPFGEVQKHNAKVVTDVAFSYDFTKAFSLSLGANNIFDVFPDKQVYSNSYFGVFKYAPVQMGTTGTFFFLKALIKIAN